MEEFVREFIKALNIFLLKMNEKYFNDLLQI